jgi:predicted permease
VWRWRRRTDEDFNEEIRADIALDTDRFMAEGLSPDEARHAALRAFGNVTRAKERFYESRRVMWLDDFFRDVRYSLRTLGRSPGFAAAAVTMLALAIGLNVTAFTVMDAMLFRGLPLATRSDRLVYLAMRKPSDLLCCPGPLSYADFEEWRSQTTAFEGMAFGGGGGPITFRAGDERPVDMAMQRVSANTFGLLGVRPMLGRDFAVADEAPGAAPVTILSHHFWERRFGKRAEIIGATVHINETPTTIVGVMPEGFVFVYEQDLWMPLVQATALEGGALGRLRDGATVQQARTELDTINRRLESADPATPRGIPTVRTYSQAHVAPDAPMIYGSLWAGAWFVLLIACANLANLMLVRTVGRWREFTTRIALGASVGRMTRQIVVEILILAGIGAALGWWIVNWSMRTWAEATATGYLALDYAVNSRTLAYLVAISAAAAIIVSLVPVIKVWQLGVNGGLTGDARGVTQGVRGKTSGDGTGGQSDGVGHGAAFGHRRLGAELSQDRERRDRCARSRSHSGWLDQIAVRQIPRPSGEGSLFRSAGRASQDRFGH